MNDNIWTIYEVRNLGCKLIKMPIQVVKKYELWKSLLHCNGPAVLRQFPGFHDESLKGMWTGFRSSRLSLKFRVIYRISWETKIIFVEDVNAHDYR